jgi:uncharacterized protein (TIGR01777 family)
MREVVITGANGWIGGKLADRLAGEGVRVIGVSRTPGEAAERRPDVEWIGVGAELEDAVRRTGAVVNLAGRHLFEQGWDDAFKGAMHDSRVGLTRRIVRALGESAATRTVLVSGSGYPVYGDTGEAEVTEEHPTSRATFLSRLDDDWEQAAAEARDSRVVRVRIALTLGLDGGALPILARPADGDAGVVLGTGEQWVAWIHVDDVVDLLATALADERWSGAVNACSPHPVRHRELIEGVTAARGHTRTITVPAADVQAMLGEAAEAVLVSTRMIPRCPLRLGFRFAHPDLRGALASMTDARPLVAG